MFCATALTWWELVPFLPPCGFQGLNSGALIPDPSCWPQLKISFYKLEEKTTIIWVLFQATEVLIFYDIEETVGISFSFLSFFLCLSFETGTCPMLLMLASN